MGSGGATAAWGLDPDLLVIGKAIAGGLPGAAFGMKRHFADQFGQQLQLDQIDTGGIGGTVFALAMFVGMRIAPVLRTRLDAVAAAV